MWGEKNITSVVKKKEKNELVPEGQLVPCGWEVKKTIWSLSLLGSGLVIITRYVIKKKTSRREAMIDDDGW